MESPVTFPSSSPPKSSTPSHSKTRSRDLSFSELDPLLREQLKPNAHPYAIKTTSTALLSRSNSTSQRQIRHSYVPSSPVQQQHQQQQQQGPTRPQGHRKGSSSFSGPILGSPSPRPLPVPPPTMSTETGAYPSTGSPSPSPRRNRLKRADTLASPEYHSDTASTPFALGEETSWIRHHHPSSQSSAAISASTLDLADLPANPKVWTPSQLSAYLTTALRVRSGVKKNEGGGGGEGGGGDGDDLKLPVRVAQDIAAFVREKKINGRVFLRWEEGDLEGYGINKLWRTALLTSSRNLRQNVLRGRIWGFEDEVQELTSPAPAPGPELTTSSILDGSSLGRTSPGAPALPTLTPIPSTMYAPSAIHPSSGTFDENEMLGAAAAAVVPSAQVDGLPLSSSNDDHGPLPPARGHFDDNDTRSSPLNRSPTRSPPREQDSEEDEDDESTPNKNSSSRKSSPPSFTSASASDEGSTTTKNTLSKRPLPNPHSYISGTNARNAGSVRTRGVPLLTPESQSMFAAEGLDLEKLAEMDTFDDFLDSGLGLGVGGQTLIPEGVSGASGSLRATPGLKGSTSMRLRPKRKSGAASSSSSSNNNRTPIGSVGGSLRVKSSVGVGVGRKTINRDLLTNTHTHTNTNTMLPTEHPNFPNGLPVYSSASDASDNDVSGGEGSSSPSLPPMLGGLGSGDAGGGGDSTGGKKKSIAMMMTGTGGRKSLSRVMARELVSKSRIGKDSPPPLPTTASSFSSPSDNARVKGMVQTFERSSSFDEGHVDDDDDEMGVGEGNLNKNDKILDKEGRRSRILEDMKVLREMARVRRERSGSTSSLSSTHSSNSAHSRSDSISSTSSSGARPGPNADDNEEVFLSSPVEQEGVQGFGTSRPLPTPPASAVSPVAPSVNFAGPGYETATAKKVQQVSSSRAPPTPPLSVGAEEPTIEELLAEQDAAAGLAPGQGQGHGHGYMEGPNEMTDTMKYVGFADAPTGGKGSKKVRVKSRVKASDGNTPSGGSLNGRKGVGVYAWEAEVEEGGDVLDGKSVLGNDVLPKARNNKGRVTAKRVSPSAIPSAEALMDAMSPMNTGSSETRPLPVPPHPMLQDEDENAVSALAQSIKQTKTMLAAFEQRLGEVETKVGAMEEEERERETGVASNEKDQETGNNKTFVQRLVYRFFGISLGSKSVTSGPSNNSDSKGTSTSESSTRTTTPTTTTPESRIQNALANRIPQQYHARLAAALDPRTLMAVAPYLIFMSIGMCVVAWRLFMRRGGVAVAARK